MSLDEAVDRVQAIGEAAWEVNPEAILLCHGGPIATPADATHVLARSDAVGFVGASSMERLPVEIAMTETMREFKAISISRQHGASLTAPVTSRTPS
jgi:predicted TIM-barrel enzyme